MMGLRLGSREELTAQWGHSTSNHQSWFIKSATPCSFLLSHIEDCEAICNFNSVIMSPLVPIHQSRGFCVRCSWEASGWKWKWIGHMQILQKVLAHGRRVIVGNARGWTWGIAADLPYSGATRSRMGEVGWQSQCVSKGQEVWWPCHVAEAVHAWFSELRELKYERGWLQIGLAWCPVWDMRRPVSDLHLI